MNFLHNIWLIPLFPAAGAVLNGLLGKKLSQRMISLIGCGVVFLSLIFSLGAIGQLMALPADQRLVKIDLFQWISAGAAVTSGGALKNFDISWGFQLDPLSAVMIFVVTLVGFLIHVYSTGYMAHEPGPRHGGYYRFFAYLNLFMFSMLTLVLANNFVLMFVGWEGVGLCSYLLIGFYFHKKSASDAGKKAFIVNRIGDAGFLLGMFLIFFLFGSLDFTTVMERAAAMPKEALGAVGVMTAVGILLFIGATGKSAQLPLYTWLPDAMEGPTPVSALIHAATMVTAGVYMVARCSALYLRSDTAMLVVATVGALTAIYAASIGLVQNDIKRVLAYSTVSQLGYMFLACGVGAFFAGIFHLLTHAFFKALLFLGAGSVIHALSGEQDLRKMGALKNKIPQTYRVMWVACFAIAGIPPLAGFWSKDEILWQAFSSPFGRTWIWLLGTAAAMMTAFYMFRLLYLTFAGESRIDHEVEHHIHESPKNMLVPLQILAFFSVIAGFIGIPAVLGKSLGIGNWIEHWLEPVFTHSASGEVAASAAEAASHSTGLELGLMLTSIAVAVVGILIARRFYFRPSPTPDQLATQFKPAYTTLLNKYYVDELYDALFVNRTKDLGHALWAFDRGVVDGGVNGSGWLTRFTATLSSWWDQYIVDGLVNVVGYTVKFLSYPLRLIQTGFVQSYALVMVLGIIFLVWKYLLR